MARAQGWNAIDAESAARMRLQNRFRTGLDIARYTAKIMRDDMAAYDADPAAYTQSLGCWHGFIGQQKMISIKKHFGTTKSRYLYLSGWMIAALRSEFGPLPDQSMHEKTSVPALIEELYTFLRQADARELGGLFRELDAARDGGNEVKAKRIQAAIDNHETHVVPIIADIDAGFGNAEATYLLAKKMIEAGACAIQIENQVSRREAVRPPGRQGHRAARGLPRQDPRGPLRLPRAGHRRRRDRRAHRLPRRRPDQADRLHQGSRRPGRPVQRLPRLRRSRCRSSLGNGDVLINRDGKLLRPKRLPSNLFQFRAGTGEDRCVLDCITSLQNGADLLWIETEKPHIGQIGGMVDRIREVIPNAKLVYNNSPSFNWTLNFRQQVFDAWQEEGRDLRPTTAPS